MWWKHRSARLASLTLSNILLPIAVLVFASGFFPYKPVLPGLATFEDVQEPGRETVGGEDNQSRAIFDRVVFMVVDALRSDFVYGFGSGFEFTQSLIRSGAAIPFTAHATPPTVTMPRVKALTTGSVPSFLDLILNFAESDTSSSLAAQDTWLAQIRARAIRANAGAKTGTTDDVGGDFQREAPLVFFGDDTWLKLFPDNFFARADGTSSFFVSDFTEVDLNVTRHLPHELAQPDWAALIMHYLGMDHIGHKTGPNGPNMLPKQREMDDIVRMIYAAIESEPHHANTLLVLAGDHGMNAGGNHGGSGPGETEPALLFASPKFADSTVMDPARRRKYACPTLPKEGTEFHFYEKLEQSDVVPTLAGLMGLPVSKNSLGVYIRDFVGLWTPVDTLRLLRQNARQMLHIVRAKYGEAAFEEKVECQFKQFTGQATIQCIQPTEEDGVLAQEWAYARFLSDAATDGDEEKQRSAEDALYAFLHHAQEAMSDTASSYNIPNMVTGMAIAALALLGSLPFASLNFNSVFFATTSELYGVMMFASSYVEEEQHFWYWLTPAWITLLGIQSFKRESAKRSRRSIVLATLTILVLHRVAVRWNQTGQKHAGEPDIVHHFFPDHHILMWLLIWTTYMFVGVSIHNRTFANLFMPEIAAFMDVALIVPAIVFKLNFAHADSPELVQGLGSKVRDWTEPLDLVFQARAIFGTIAATAAAVVVLAVMQSRSRESEKTQKFPSENFISLTERLHPLLTLFLMTQTRAANVPLFLALEIQCIALNVVLEPLQPSSSSEGKASPSKWQHRATQISTTVLLLSHVYYFCMGGSNSISSIDLSNAYNGVADYNILAVGVLLFASNWAAPIWWCSAAVLLMQPPPPSPPPMTAEEEAWAKSQANGGGWIAAERAKLSADAAKAVKPKQPVVNKSVETMAQSDDECWTLYVAHMTGFIAAALLAVMAACTALRTHLFIWTVFSPKYLYAMAWSAGWHLLVNVGFGSLLCRTATVV